MKNTYDPKNNDTYEEIYSLSLSRDVEIHMFKREKGIVCITGLNGKIISGDFSEESSTIAKNNVLHFESPKNLNLKFLKYKNVNTLIPLSLLQRYKKNLNQIEYTQKTPVFFDIKSEKFVLALDNRFLRDLNGCFEFKKSIEKIENVSIVFSSDAEQILLSYESLEDLYQDKNKTFEKIKQEYLKQLLKIYPNEDVIVVAYALEENQDAYFSINGARTISHQALDNNIFSNCQIQFEFLKARKISSSHYYVYEDNENMNLKEPFYFDKDKKDSFSNNTGIFLGTKKSLLIIPYNDYNWTILHNLKNNIDDIFQGLDSLLSQQKNDNSLDKSIGDIQNHPHLLSFDCATSKNNKLKASS